MAAATAVKKASAARSQAKPAAAAAPAPPQPRSRRQVPLTPMRQETAKRIRKLADQVQQSHPDMTVHDHLRDAARVLESGNEEGAQRHLRAAAFSLSPQSLMRHGLHTDDAHTAARQAVHGVHRHILLVKDIQDAAAKNQAAIRRDSYGDDSTSNPLPKPLDPNAGYGPGALAQKPTARQPGGDKAMNAPNRVPSGGSDPNAADPDGPQPRGSKQFAYGWDDLARVIEFASVIDLVGPHGYIHNWIFVGIPGAGQKVTLGSGHHATGTVTGADATHVHVRMADGTTAHIAHNGGTGPGKLAKIPTATPQYKSTSAGRDQVSKALTAASGAAPGKASSAQGKRTQTELLARAVSNHPQMTSDEVLNEHVAGMRASLNAGDTASFNAHRDAAEARIRQHGMMPAGDIKDTVPAPRKGKGAGNEKQLSLLGERMNGPDKTSGTMQAGDMQEGYQAIGQAPNGIVGGTSDPWWMAGPGGTFALSVRDKSGNRTLIPWSSEKQRQSEADAMKAVLPTVFTQGGRTQMFYSGKPSNYQRALAANVAEQALQENARRDKLARAVQAETSRRQAERDAAQAKAAKAAARQAAQAARNAEAERGIVQKSGGDLKAGDHIAGLPATSLVASASLAPGGTRVTLTDGRTTHVADGETLSVHPAAGPLKTMTGSEAADKMTAAATTVARLKAASSMTDGELGQANQELARRAALLGKAGQLSKGHQAVHAEMKQRGIAMSVTWNDLASVIALAAGDNCYRCSIPNAPDAMHCKRCGFAMEPRQPYDRFASEDVTCPFCGRGDDADAVFCDQCGKRMPETPFAAFANGGHAIELSAKTAALEVTPAPRGKPGGPGLYRVAGNEHSPYLQQIVKALIEKRGMPPGKAYAIAWGALRKWSRGGGGVHPEVTAAAGKALGQEAAASAKAHSHAVTWDDIGAEIELATVLEFFNPAQPRVPAGQLGGGQFSAGGGGGQSAQGGQAPAKQPAQTPAQKAAAAAAAKAHAAHVAHVAHVAHQLGVSTNKAELLVTAQDDRQKAAGLIQQRNALLKALQSAAGKVSSGQAGSKTATTAKTKSSAPAKSKSSSTSSTAKTASTKTASTSTKAKSSTASTKASAAKTTASKAASSTAAAAKSAATAAAIRAQVAQLNTQINQLLAQAKQAETQAATMK